MDIVSCLLFKPKTERYQATKRVFPRAGEEAKPQKENTKENRSSQKSKLIRRLSRQAIRYLIICLSTFYVYLFCGKFPNFKSCLLSVHIALTI